MQSFRIIAIISALCLSAQLCQARLGETQEECRARYGEPKVMQYDLPYKLCEYEKNGIEIQIRFIDGKAAYIQFIAPLSVLRLESAVELVTANSQGKAWAGPIKTVKDMYNSSVPMTEYWWRRDDGGRACISTFESIRGREMRIDIDLEIPALVPAEWHEQWKQWNAQGDINGF